MHDRQIARRPGEGDVQSPETDWVVAPYQLRFDDDGRIELQPLRSRRRHEIDRLAEPPLGCVGEGNALSLQLTDDIVVKRIRADDADEQPAARVLASRIDGALRDVVTVDFNGCGLAWTLADCPRRRDVGSGEGEQSSRELVDLPRYAITQLQGVLGDWSILSQLVRDRVPCIGRPGAGRLREISDQCQGSGGASAPDRAKLHRREVLGFIDHDVAVGAEPAAAADQQFRFVEQGDVAVAPPLVADAFCGLAGRAC